MPLESTLLDASSYIDGDTERFQEGVCLNSKTFRSRKESSIPQVSAGRLKELSSHSAVSIVQHCLRKMRMHIRDRYERKNDEFTETFAATSGTRTERMSKDERN